MFFFTAAPPKHFHPVSKMHIHYMHYMMLIMIISIIIIIIIGTLK